MLPALTRSQGRSAQTHRLRKLGISFLGIAVLAACGDDKMGPKLDEGLAPEGTPQALIPGGATGYDLNDPTLSPVNVNGALWIFPSEFSVGTGLIDPFLSIQNGGSQVGFNTDGSFLLDQTRPQFTDALPLNNVPIIQREGVLYREVILDANEANSAPAAQFSIDLFDLFVCIDESGDLGPPVAGDIPLIDMVSDFDPNPNCQLVYSFEPGHTGFATDGLTAGSGQRLDYDILIPEANFDALTLSITTDDCPYNPIGDECGLWVVLHSAMGGFGGDWVTGSTFEEYSTLLQPFVQVEKTAVPEFTREHTWEITKAVTPEDIYLFEGQSQDADYTVVVTQTGTEDSGWNVSGSVTITNPSDSDATITAVTDLLQPGDIPVTLDCGGLPTLLEGGDDLVCTYSHDFGSDPGQGEFTNTVEVELDGLAVTMGESESFSFTDPTNEINGMVDVEDLFEGTDLTTLASGIETGDTYTYSHTFTCDEDDGGHPNTASVIGDGDEVLAEASANVDVHCLDVEVTKDAETALARTFLWTIDKSVTPAQWDLFDGDEGTSDYTVTVTPDGFEDMGLMVTGNIHINNPNDVSVFIQAIDDELTGGIVATVQNCEVDATPIGALPYELAAGATIDCTYSATPPDDTDRTNTATVEAKPTAAGDSEDFTGTAEVSFANAELMEVNNVINVEDTYPSDPTALGTADWDDGVTTFEYSRTFACDADGGTHDNTATIVETDQSDDASVTVNCYELAVTKDAATEWTRTWDWTIDKVVDPSHFLDGTYDEATSTATVQEGQVLEVFWDITLDATSIDSDFNVAGQITVSNAGNPVPAVINSVSDIITAGAIDGNPSCGVTFPHTIAVGGSLVCSYGPVDLPTGDDRTNTATATQQNFSYASDLSPTDNGTTDYMGTADIMFAATPTFEIDECVNVEDILNQGGFPVGGTIDVVPGTYCASEGLPETFEISRTFGGADGIVLVCDNNTFINTATFTTNDTQSQGSDPATINIFVECVVGCTLTQGYWKTHNDSFKGGANKKADLTWQLIAPSAEQSPFFLSGDSWFGVFWTAPKGNAYYNLAHQYMAAKLNTLAGATPPTEVATALAEAEAYLAANTPEDAGALKGKNAKTLRDWAGIFGDFNEGLIGPGHCTENGS